MPIQGIGTCQIGRTIRDICSKEEVIDFVGTLICQKHGVVEKRAIGFYDPDAKSYHFYLTNLELDAQLIYPLYRPRWQCEMIFKSCKSSLDLDEVPMANPNIVMNLMLSSVLSYLISLLTLEVAKDELSEQEAQAVTPQRIAKVFVHLNSGLLEYFLCRVSKRCERLKNKILLFARELFGPNYRHRSTSLQEAMALC